MQRELKLCKSESDMTKSRPEVVISKQEIDGTKKNLFPPRIVTTEPNHRLSAQARVIDDSEADRILAKYSKRSAGALTHPNMRTSLSDTAIASHVSESVEIQLENFPLPDEKSSGLELELEFNSGLQKKLPNLLQSARMSRKTHRVYESLKQHIQQSLGDDVCQSTIIFV
ncbi:hypothetical protein DPMN_167019 [Dreissena polymorpha]|uniref:Uncharacterized protein n=1 Tax=Dreissena polymorpha TaxID=45954 RepID=A0A9D4IY57_DREPO|nr:hypothetical protein DPMN_167019 [Dreissena polymorpha]